MMKKLIIFLLLSSISINSFGFEIFALGTSNTNCKGADQAYTNTLNDLFIQEKINVQVINAGVDGDKPAFMMNRLEQGLKSHPNIKMVIFEPGPNERNPSFNLGPSEEILSYLQKIKMPTIYVSHSLIQTNEEGQALATKYGAYYYGHWNKDVPTNSTYRQYDQPGSAGHMTVAGCQLWAKNMFPFIKQVMKAVNIQ
jgi:hypothetical protein